MAKGSTKFCFYSRLEVKTLLSSCSRAPPFPGSDCGFRTRVCHIVVSCGLRSWLEVLTQMVEAGIRQTLCEGMQRQPVVKRNK